MKKISCICTILILTAFVVTTSVVFPASAQTTKAVTAENVELVGVTFGPCYAVAVDGNTAYISAGVYLLILNITDKGSPALLGSVRLPGVVHGIAVSDGYAYVAVSGEYAYVADGYSGLRVVDLRNPASPKEVGFYDTPGKALGVAVSGGYAYVAAWRSGLRVVDVKNPASPKEVGFYDTPDSDSAKSVAVSGGYAYVVDAFSFVSTAYLDDDYRSGLHVVDVSNPASPKGVGFCEGDARSVAVSGGYAYVVDSWSGGLRVVDVSNTASPTEKGFYDTPGDARSVAVSGGYAYVADGGSGLRVVDVRNPASPKEVGFYDMPDGVGGAVDVAVSGGYTYIAERGSYDPILEGDSGLRVVDVSNPASPKEVGFYETFGHANGVAVSGGYAYVAADWDGLRVVDVSNPASPKEVGFYNTSGIACGVAVANGLVYVAGSGGGMSILRFTAP